MPSCDKVGRYFPLVVAQARPSPPSERFALDHLELWWAHAAQCALQTLAEGAAVEQFEAGLEELPPWPAPGSARSQPLGQRLDIRAGATLAEWVQDGASAELQQRLLGHSIWWPWRPQAEDTSCLVLPGLPAPADFARMLVMQS
jgi:type VI secretion system protein ImpM